MTIPPGYSFYHKLPEKDAPFGKVECKIIHIVQGVTYYKTTRELLLTNFELVVRFGIRKLHSEFMEPIKNATN